jgi:hypothetical protein
MTVATLLRSRWKSLSGTTWLQLIAPWVLVAMPVLFNLRVLAQETSVVQNPNDSALHLSMVQWARLRIDEGHVPLDGWFPWLGLGSANFHHYQTLPHVITAYLSLLFGVGTTFFWSIYLLLALWPVSVYVGVRLLGWDRWTAAAAAVVSPLLFSASGYGLEHSSYTWRGYGLWPQLWGQTLLPVAWGLAWRAIRGRGSIALAVLATALTIACHVIVGYIVMMAIGLWSLIALRDLPRRIVRAALVAVGAVLAASWVIVPTLSDLRWIPLGEYGHGTFFEDSFGAPTILGWLFTGRLYDQGRFPVISILVAVGMLVCLVRFRRDERARAVVVVWLVSLVLFFGPPTLGPIGKAVPGLEVVPLHRLIMGVHMAGIVLAGIGAAWLGNWLVTRGGRFVPEVKPALQAAVVVAFGILSLSPAWTERATFDQTGADMKVAQAAAEETDGADLAVLVDRVRAFGDGRVFAGARNTWGGQYTIGYVPVYSVVEDSNLDTVGYVLRVTSLMIDPEVVFDENNPAQYDLFNVRYLILPVTRQPAVKATLLARQGRHALWQVDTSGYMDVVDTVGPPIAMTRANVAAQTTPFMQSPDLAQKRFSWIAYDGQAAPDPTLLSTTSAPTPAGSVQVQSGQPADGNFSAEVIANRPAVVLLKTSYDPRWIANVDGADIPPQMIAPAFMGVPVATGHHLVSFRYVPYPQYPTLISLGVLTILLLAVTPWLLRGVSLKALLSRKS